MSNGHYPSPNAAYQGVHALIGHGAVVRPPLSSTTGHGGFLPVLVFGLVKEFIIDVFGKEHDSFRSSLQDFTCYMVGAAVGIIVVTVVK